MRTQEEIVGRIRASRSAFLSFEPEVLLPYLTFEHAREFLKPEVTDAEWSGLRSELSDAGVLETARVYMQDYGWPKAEDHRGLSASRTVSKMKCWLWLLNTPALDALLRRVENEEIPYTNYGAPILAAICREMDWPIPKSPVLAAMMRSEKCPECVENGEGGCGGQSDE